MKTIKKARFNWSMVGSVTYGGKKYGGSPSERGKVAARRMLSLHNPFDSGQKLW